jgi:pimeloyl-ACP methyl ester carboxylesterase
MKSRLSMNEINSAKDFGGQVAKTNRPAKTSPVLPPVKGKLTVQRFIVPYRVYGAGNHSLVFVNGVQQSMAMWYSFVRRFSGTYRIVLFDLPNQGAGRTVTGPVGLSLQEEVDILSAVIDAVGGAAPVTLCSASWGGVIAMAYAVDHSDRLKSLILASMGTRPNQRMVEMILRGLQTPVKDPIEIAETMIEGMGQDLPPAMKSKIINQFRHMTPEAFQAFLQHGATVISVRELSKVVDVSKVQCKTIILHGEKDTIVDLNDVRYLASQTPRSQLTVIKNVGHFLHLEKEELLDVYEDILASSQ